MVPWLVLALLWPLLYSFVNIIDKFLIEKRVKNYYSYGVLTGVLFLLSVGIIWSLVDLPTISKSVLFFGTLAGVTYGIIYLMYFRFLAYAEVSRIIGMGYLFVAFVAVYSRIFLGEELSVIKYGAILVAIFGTMLLGVHKHGQKLKFTHFFWLMILYAAILGIVDVSDKYVVEHVTFWEAYILVTIPLGIVLLSPLASTKVRADLRQAARSLPGIILAQVFTIAGSLTFLAAAAQAPIAIVSALGTLQPVFVFLLMLLSSVFTPRMLKEIMTPRVLGFKMLGIACVVAAAVVLSL